MLLRPRARSPAQARPRTRGSSAAKRAILLAEQLWAELEKLLLAKPELKTYLKVPTAIEIAVYNAMDDERFYSGRY